jgi:hypothetical protein
LFIGTSWRRDATRRYFRAGAARFSITDQNVGVTTDRDVLRDVWNRACFGKGNGVGDRHLAALLLVDGMVQNGGPNHAADCEPAELAAAAAAARYFGLEALAAVIDEIPAAASDNDEAEAAEERLSDAYYEAEDDGRAINDAFEARYAAAPEDFDPV